MDLTAYQPTSKLVVKQTLVEKPRFPVIDAHNHLGGSFGGDWDRRPVDELLAVLDQAEVKVYVDLDGGWGEEILQNHLDHFKAAAPHRFIHFGGVDWSCWPEQGDRFAEWAASRLQKQVEWGAEGLKIWKGLGLQVKDEKGNVVPVEDSRLDPIWVTAGELDVPVLIHIADPVAFFDPLDEYNERWEELQAHPDWHFPTPPHRPILEIVNGLAEIVTRHPDTIFIGAHVGCYAENLAWVGALLDRASNFYVDIGARISELGRQPYSTRKFFQQYPGRILFGTDMGADLKTYQIYYRFLETDDEYFDYGTGATPAQGRWRIYGINLPDDILEKIYYKNAVKLFNLDQWF